MRLGRPRHIYERNGGEFYSQTDEFDRIHAVVAREAERAGVPFQIGACNCSAQLTLKRVRRAKSPAPGAFQVISLDWLKVGIDEAIAFLSRVAEAAAPVPLVLYNPPHAKRVLEPAELSRLQAAVPALIGVKKRATLAKRRRHLLSVG